MADPSPARAADPACSVQRPEGDPHADPSAQGSELLDLVGPLWSAGHTCEVLGLTVEDFDDARQRGHFLGLNPTDSDLFFYPVAQFERRDGMVRVVSGVTVFLRPLIDLNPWTVVVLLNTPAAELDGVTPLKWARERRGEAQLSSYASLLRDEFSR